jgi:HPt (histidine-containing phosphotransfer) domain-containing protein
MRAMPEFSHAKTDSKAGKNAEDQSTLIFDEDDFMERTGGGSELLIILVDMFLERYPGQLSEIQKAIAQNDGKKLERLAHGLKGSASNLSAKAVADAAMVLEEIGQKGDVKQAEESYEKLKNQVEKLRLFFEELQRKNHSTITSHSGSESKNHLP